VIVLLFRKIRPLTAAAASSGVDGNTDFNEVPTGKVNEKVNVLLTCVATFSG
jgi:hypothetical protein